MDRSTGRRTSALLLAGAFVLGAPAPSPAAPVLPTGFTDSVVVAGLKQPTGMAWLPDGRLLVIEQVTANVRLIVKDTLVAAPIFTVPDVNTDFLERGLLGVAVDPGFPARPYAYFFLSHLGTPTTSWIVRYALTGDLADGASANLAVDPSSAFPIITDIPDDQILHNGGSLRFGPDGLLYASVGDDGAPCAAQDPTGLRGVLLRLNVAGLPDTGTGPPPKSLLVPAGNPFSGPNDNARLTIAYGLRNPFRIHVDPATGRVLIGDVGQATVEEIDILEPDALGQNFGWPLREGPNSWILCPGVSTALPFRAPIAYYDHGDLSDVAVIAAGIYRGVQHPLDRSFPPDYEGDAFFAEYYAGFLRRLHRAADGTWGPAAPVPGQPSPTDWAQGISTPADFGVGPDGALYYLSQFGAGGSLHRISYDSSPTLRADDTRAAAGATGVTVAVRTSTSLAVGATDVRLRFDPSALQATAVTSDLVQGFGVVIDNTTGTVTTASGAGTVAASAPLFTVTFQVRPGITGCSALGVEDADGVPPDDVTGADGTSAIVYKAVGGTFCASTCGNGVRELGEDCDDGNRAAGDCCDPTCRFEPAGSACPDTACTLQRRCDGAGTCGAGTAKGCDDGNPCTTDGCSAASGCTHDPNTAPCSDGNACTTGDACAAGACVGGPAPDCDDRNVCTVDGCDPALGCIHTLTPGCTSCTGDAQCANGNACDGAERCVAGSCTSGAALDCDDRNPCTTDGCDPALGCTHTSNTAPCDDGNACTTGDACAAGTCVGGPAPDCDDRNACTVDACDPTLGCRHIAVAGCASCSTDPDCGNGNACDGVERCVAGACTVGTPLDCNDGNPCTSDTCDPARGCVHAPGVGPCQDAAIIARVPDPLGGGNHDLEVIRDGDTPPVGNQDSTRQYDTWDGPNAASEDWIGYDYGGKPQVFTRVVFQEGKHFVDGGWFESLTVQVRRNGTWVEAAGVTSTPPYPAIDDGISYQTYTLSFAPTAGDAIRIYGVPGGSADFISVAELIAAHQPDEPPIADAGPDQTAGPQQLVVLDGTGSEHPAGVALAYHWTQTAGPSVVLANDVSAQPSFTAPDLPTGTTLTFSLIVDDGALASAPDTVTVSLDGATELTQLGTIIARVPQPLGGGNHDLGVIRDGDLPPVGSRDSTRQYDTWDGPNAASEDWIGYDYGRTLHVFATVVFQEGRHFVDGGWFDSLTVQVRQAGTWQEVAGLVVEPAYPGGDDGLSFQTYTLRFAPTSGDAIRVYGVPGGSAAFISVGELQVFGTASVTHVPTADAGADQDAGPGQIVALDGSGSSDLDGDQLTYLWTQTAGPTVALSDPTSARPTFQAPALDGATAVAFSLRVSDGTATSAPSIVTITLRNASDLTRLGRIIARVPNPLGGGNHDLGVIRDGDRPPVGTLDSSRQYDSWDGPNAATEDWVGYDYAPALETFDGVVFQEGKHFVDGGWFESLTVQVRQAGIWTEVSGLTVTPPYPGADDGSSYESYTLTFAPTVGDAIRIYGAPGGSADFISVAELQVFGVEGAIPLPVADAGSDRDVRPGELVTLDGSRSSDPARSVLAYLWTQTAGPAVVLSDPTAARPTFTAPPATTTTALAFSLRVSSGALGSASAGVVLTEHAGDLTARGRILARVRDPLGGGNHDLEVIRDGDLPPVGNQESLRQYDSWDGPNTAVADWIGYDFAPGLRTFTRVVFQEGKHFVDGGWFDDLRVQVRQGGMWNDVSGLAVTPAYPAADDGASYETYTLRFTPAVGDAIRLYGTPGGSADFISVGELRVLDDCGDGVVTAPEECDPPGTATCAEDCTLRAPTCGDGVVTPPEECDDGNRNDCDGCSSRCTLPPVSFACDVMPLFGAGHGACFTCHGSAGAAAGLVLDPAAPGATFANLVGRPSRERPLLLRAEPGSSTDSYLIMKELGAAGIGGKRMPATDPTYFDAHVGELATQQLWIDQGAQADACAATCLAHVCGDGILDPLVEACDDGNNDPNDGCSPTCQIEFCGDGIVNDGNEQCEPPGTTTCTPDCQLR